MGGRKALAEGVDLATPTRLEAPAPAVPGIHSFRPEAVLGGTESRVLVLACVCETAERDVIVSANQDELAGQ